MPFKSDKQRKYMHAKHPTIAKRWEKEEKVAGYSKAKPAQRAAYKKVASNPKAPAWVKKAASTKDKAVKRTATKQKGK